MSIGSIRLITFDATNTLLKFRIPPWHYYTIVAKDFGYTGTEEDVKAKLIDSYKFMWEKYPNFGKSLITWDQWWHKVVERTFQGHMPDGKDVMLSNILIEQFKTSKLWCVAEGARQLLNVLETKAISSGIISNFDPRLHDILKSVGIANQFKFVITSYEVGYSKPDKRIFELAMKKVGVRNPKECLHIGDDVKKDYQGAISAGWRALIVPSDGAMMASQSDKTIDSSHVYPNLSAVANALDKCEIA